MTYCILAFKKILPKETIGTITRQLLVISRESTLRESFIHTADSKTVGCVVESTHCFSWGKHDGVPCTQGQYHIFCVRNGYFKLMYSE